MDRLPRYIVPRPDGVERLVCTGDDVTANEDNCTALELALATTRRLVKHHADQHLTANALYREERARADGLSETLNSERSTNEDIELAMIRELDRARRWAKAWKTTAQVRDASLACALYSEDLIAKERDGLSAEVKRLRGVARAALAHVEWCGEQIIDRPAMWAESVDTLGTLAHALTAAGMEQTQEAAKGLPAIVGQWPGDETDAEIEAAEQETDHA